MPPQPKKPRASQPPPEANKPTPTGTTYPSAPEDPAARREHFWARNAAIQGVDPDTYAEALREQADRARAHGDRDLRDVRNKP